jgi:NADH-quinone oxidoreductase subunit N
MAFFLFSLGGFPPTVGFVAKFLVFSAAIQQSYMSLAFWGIATSAVSAFYYLRVGLLLFQRPREGEATYEWSRTTLAGGTVLLTTTAATLGLGIFISFLYNAATMAQAGIKG